MSKVTGVAYINEDKFTNVVKAEVLGNDNTGLITNFFNPETKEMVAKIKEIVETEKLGKNVVVISPTDFNNVEVMTKAEELKPVFLDKNNVVVIQEYAHFAPNTQNLLLQLCEIAKATHYVVSHPESARLLGVAFRGHSTHFGVELDAKPQSKMKF